MKKLLETLKGARWVELLLLCLVVCLFLMMLMQEEGHIGTLSLEEKIARSLSCVEGAGKVQVLLGEDDDSGIVVIAEGAGNIRVMLDLQRSVSTLTGLPVEKIEILRSE